MPSQPESNGAVEPDTDRPLAAGVVGVGSMGENHARIYEQLRDVELIGVADLDEEAASAVAESYGCRPMPREALLDAADLVSVAVPTPVHAGVVGECIERGTHVLVEKPFVDDLAEGRELVRRADEAGVTVQVGHVERFNPAIRELPRILSGLDVVAVDAHRLGPPVDDGRDLDRSVVRDLMIHDLDVVTNLLDANVTEIDAYGSHDAGYVNAVGHLEGGVTASFTASRTTHRKVRRLGITTRECRIEVDYADRRIELHHQSRPAYVAEDGDVRHRVESVVERPMVQDDEPLRAELASFVDAATTGREPVVTAEDGLSALALCRRIESLVETPSEAEVNAS